MRFGEDIFVSVYSSVFVHTFPGSAGVFTQMYKFSRFISYRFVQEDDPNADMEVTYNPKMENKIIPINRGPNKDKCRAGRQRQNSGLEN